MGTLSILKRIHFYRFILLEYVGGNGISVLQQLSLCFFRGAFLFHLFHVPLSLENALRKRAQKDKNEKKKEKKRKKRKGKRKKKVELSKKRKGKDGYQKVNFLSGEEEISKNALSINLFLHQRPSS